MKNRPDDEGGGADGGADVGARADAAIGEAHAILGLDDDPQQPSAVFRARPSTKQQRLRQEQRQREEQEPEEDELPRDVDRGAVMRIIDDCKHRGDELELNLPCQLLLFVPKPVRQLRRLRVLNLRNNRISMLPTELCEALTDLEVLVLSYNRLRYLPENVSSMTHLRLVSLEHNELEGLPDGAFHLPLLQELKLDHNRLDELSPGVVRLQQLRVLTATCNELSMVPPELCRLKHLHTLDISNNPMDYEALPDSLFRLNEMHTLLRSKRQRQTAIQRANSIRRSVRNAFLEQDVFASMPKPPASASDEGGSVDGGGSSVMGGRVHAGSIASSSPGDGTVVTGGSI